MSEVLEIDFSQLDESVLKEIGAKIWPGKRINFPKYVEPTKIRDPRHDFLDARVEYLRARFLKYQPPKRERKSTSPGSKLKSLSPVRGFEIQELDVRDNKFMYNTPQIQSPNAGTITPNLKNYSKKVYSRNQVELPEIQSLKK